MEYCCLYGQIVVYWSLCKFFLRKKRIFFCFVLFCYSSVPDEYSWKIKLNNEGKSRAYKKRKQLNEC